jgi:hypothetical protein
MAAASTGISVIEGRPVKVVGTHLVQEYRGVDLPALSNLQLKHYPRCGDFYIVTSSPHRVFYYSGTKWLEWTGLEPITCHPKIQALFMYPTKDGWTWGDSGSKKATIARVHERFGAAATVHEYVEAILQKEKEMTEEKRIDNAIRRYHRLAAKLESQQKEQMSKKRKRDSTPAEPLGLC